MNCKQEVEELHHFFEGWFKGELENADDVWGRLEGVLDPDFLLISPNGMRAVRDALLFNLRTLHGSRKGEVFKIWTEAFQVRHEGGGVALATYREHQSVGGEETQRVTTAVFREHSEAKNGCRWLHVHETWLDA